MPWLRQNAWDRNKVLLLIYFLNFNQSVLQRNAHVGRGTLQWRDFFRWGATFFDDLFGVTIARLAPHLLGGHYCIIKKADLQYSHSCVHVLSPVAWEKKRLDASKSASNLHYCECLKNYQTYKSPKRNNKEKKNQAHPNYLPVGGAVSHETFPQKWEGWVEFLHSCSDSSLWERQASII